MSDTLLLALGQYNDGFVSCPQEALTWECRKYQILQEIIQTNPDVICLQEVDHFKFLQGMLSTLGYEGVFFPKPDSPCLYIEENNGPDGCAIFYRSSKFEMLRCMTRVLEVWRVQSNQVAIAAILRVRETGYELCLGTTHLKARHGALLSKLRNEQGKDLLRFVKDVATGRPIILCGDFNAEPSEPVYSTILSNKDLGLSSAYAEILSKSSGGKRKSSGHELASGDTTGGQLEEQAQEDVPQTRAEVMASHEPNYTTWKIREDGGEVCHCIDYVFYSQSKFHVDNCLMFPGSVEVGKNRVPSFRYPSDHFSLVCDFRIRNEDGNSPVED